MKKRIIERNDYLQKLIDSKGNGLIKILTGIRRCGKSYLLDPIFKNHLMENIIYNELLLRGYNVDAGVVEIREGDNRKQLEVDFVCNLGNKRYYVQSTLNLETREKTIQEERPLMNIDDNFKKIIIVKDDIKHWITEEGILVIGIKEFLLNKNSLDL